jgi:hypothetical protein
MSNRDEELASVPLAVLIDGFEQACSRFYAVMNETDHDAAFLPLFEALSWIVCLDERFQDLLPTSPTGGRFWSDDFGHGDTLKGVRFARNRVQHQWADAVAFSLGTRQPRQAAGEWRWRPTLTSRGNSQFEAQYKQHVAAHPVRVTLGQLQDCFAAAADELDDLDRQDLEDEADSLD